MAVTAKLVSELREKTGAGMMDCKKALEETNGDFEKAIEYLRKKGAAVAAKRAEKAVSEGVVITKVSADGKTAAILEMNCETDFVAKSEDFINTASKLVEGVFKGEFSSTDDFLASKIDTLTAKELVDELMGKVGEKIVVSRFAKLNVPSGIIVDYIHPGSKLGVLVAFQSTANLDDEFVKLGKDIAMQIAAMRPMVISRDQVEKSVLDKEIEIYKAQAKQEGKPDNIAEKIAIGRVEKFYKEVCLLEQDFVKDSSKVVGTLLKEFGAKIGSEIKTEKFLRFHLGDEKK